MDVRAGALRDGIWRLAARLAQASPRTEDLDEVAATLCFLAGARAVALYALTGPANGHPFGLRVLGAHGHPNVTRGRGPAAEVLPPSALSGDVRAALRDRAVVSTPRIAAEGTPSDLAALHRQGFFSALAVPVVHGTQPLGAVHALFGSARDAERALAIEQFAPLLAAALARPAFDAGAALQTWPVGPARRPGGAADARGAAAEVGEGFDAPLAGAEGFTWDTEATDEAQPVAAAPPAQRGPAAPDGPLVTLEARFDGTPPALALALRRAHALGTRNNLSYAVAMYRVADADRLRAHYGAAWLGAVLDRLVALVGEEARITDEVGRAGADGVLLVLPGTGAEGAFAQVRRLFMRFGQLSFVAGEGRLQVGLRCGISAWPVDGAVTGAASHAAAAAAAEAAAAGPWVVAIAAEGAARAYDLGPAGGR